jgi:hypothetical protein
MAGSCSVPLPSQRYLHARRASYNSCQPKAPGKK